MTAFEMKFHKMANFIIGSFDIFIEFLEKQNQEHLKNLSFFFQNISNQRNILFSLFSNKLTQYLSKPPILSTICEILIALYDSPNDISEQTVADLFQTVRDRIEEKDNNILQLKQKQSRYKEMVEELLQQLEHKLPPTAQQIANEVKHFNF